jgi:hypothetical protein
MNYFYIKNMSNRVKHLIKKDDDVTCGLIQFGYGNCGGYYLVIRILQMPSNNKFVLNNTKQIIKDPDDIFYNPKRNKYFHISKSEIESINNYSYSSYWRTPYTTFSIEDLNNIPSQYVHVLNNQISTELDNVLEHAEEISDTGLDAYDWSSYYYNTYKVLRLSNDVLTTLLTNFANNPSQYYE